MKKIFIVFIVLLFGIKVNSQNVNLTPENYFSYRKYMPIKFSVKEKSEIYKLSRLINIDNVKGNIVFAYVDKQQLKDYIIGKYSYSPNIPVANEKAYTMATTVAQMASWDRYPTYSVYAQLMAKFQTDYPQLCKVYTMRQLSSGRKLFVAKISENVNSKQARPQFLYSSTMHGDETTGFILMLRLMDYLLKNYNTDSRVKSIVDNVELWICPDANPDGTYHSGDNFVSAALSYRYNANYKDLNRNYPDPEDSITIYNAIQENETQAFMIFADTMNFTMAANFHGGVEVLNYPWDRWAYLHTDDNWWQYISREYADTVHSHSLSGYFTFLDNGITNGYAWFGVIGGRQDYMNYFHHCRELTIEISDDKCPQTQNLNKYWEYNYRSLLNYIEQVKYGVRGLVTDSITGVPLRARVYINGHDRDSSDVYSRLLFGDYYRLLNEGVYNITYSSPGYISKTIQNVNVQTRTATLLDVQLVNDPFYYNEELSLQSINIYPNPFETYLCIDNILEQSETYCKIYNVLGEKVFETSLLKGKTLINTSSFIQGIYFVKIINGQRTISRKMIR